jgi:hypothetical protein
MISLIYDIIDLWYHGHFKTYDIIANIIILWYHMWYHAAQGSRWGSARWLVCQWLQQWLSWHRHWLGTDIEHRAGGPRAVTWLTLTLEVTWAVTVQVLKFEDEHPICWQYPQPPSRWVVGDHHYPQRLGLLWPLWRPGRGTRPGLFSSFMVAVTVLPRLVFNFIWILADLRCRRYTYESE